MEISTVPDKAYCVTANEWTMFINEVLGLDKPLDLVLGDLRGYIVSKSVYEAVMAANRKDDTSYEHIF